MKHFARFVRSVIPRVPAQSFLLGPAPAFEEIIWRGYNHGSFIDFG